MLTAIKDLIQYRDLLFILAARDIKVRYKQTFMGIAWALLQPLSLVIIFTIVFSKLARVPSEGIPYPIFSYCAILPWIFFSSSVNTGVSSIVSNMNLVTKIYFPREVLPFATMIACLFDFLIASIIFIGMMIFYKISLTIYMFWVPLIILIQIIFTLGFVLLSSAGNVFFRDVKHVMPILVQLWMYLTPIIYPLSLVPEKYKVFYMLNPMAGIIESYRNVILKDLPPDYFYLSLAFIVSLVLFILGYTYFKKSEKVFADII
ncbi:MAG: ABC transporter permease [bacterium]|nr:ABC transporter permease [bacterium]